MDSHRDNIDTCNLNGTRKQNNKTCKDIYLIEIATAIFPVLRFPMGTWLQNFSANNLAQIFSPFDWWLIVGPPSP